MRSLNREGRAPARRSADATRDGGGAARALQTDGGLGMGVAKGIHRPTVDRVLTLDFLAQRENVIVVAPHGLGKTMIAKNLVQRPSSPAIRRASSPRRISSSISRGRNGRALQHRLRSYLRPSLLAIDEIGYLAYDAHAADLLFQVVSRRYEQKSIVITTNLSFRFVCLLWFVAGTANAQAPTKVHEVFKAKGTGANTVVPIDGVSVNGIGDAMFLEVFQDPASGDTSLFFRVISRPNGIDNRTTYFVGGAIPSADFVIAPDLSSATLNTTINTSPGQFDNAELGPIVGLVINLTWSPDSFGHLVTTSRFTERIPGTRSAIGRRCIKTVPARPVH